MKQRVVLSLFAITVTLVGLHGTGLQAQGRPIISRDHLDDTFTTGFCGFPMEVRTTGTGVFHVFLDDNGDLDHAIITSAAIRLSFTNLDTGESIWTPSVNMTLVSVDGNTGTQSYRGLLWRLVLPHEGLVTADTGRIDFLYTFDEDGNPISQDVVFIAGQQDNQFISAVCATLGS